jgi:FkbM family methyltransferase
MKIPFLNPSSDMELRRVISERDKALAENIQLREQLTRTVSATDVLKLVQDRESAKKERDDLVQRISEAEVNHADLPTIQSERDSLALRVAQLEAEMANWIRPGTEDYDLTSAQRLRDRMVMVQPYFPISTAGVFSYSQHQQELFALETLNFKRGGFFLEIGVGPGTSYSNTYLLEKYFGWNGILCEPNPNYIESIKSSRTVTLDQRAVYSRSGENVKFLCVPGIYGLLSTMSDFVHSDAHQRYGEHVEVPTVSLEDVLVQNNAPNEIDYISIDTEGSETEIIGNFDFNKWNISILTIEHNLVPGRIEVFDSILGPFGYERVYADISGGDAWYCKNLTNKRGIPTA